MKIIVGSPRDGKWILEASSESEFVGDCDTDTEAICFFLTHAITVTCFDALVEKLNEEKNNSLHGGEQ